jgi:hypothetical protein
MAGTIFRYNQKIKVMAKFNKYESGIIISSLNLAMTGNLSDIKAAEEAGKTPLFTAEYIQSTYAELIQRVEEMTAKK